MKKITIFIFLITLNVFASKSTFELKHFSDIELGCPATLSLVSSNDFIITTFTFEDGLKNIKNYNFSAPQGLIKGLAYPFGIFTYYRNHQDQKGFYFQRQNCERIGPENYPTQVGRFPIKTSCTYK